MSLRIEINLPTLHPAQKKIKREAKRFNTLRCGRRFGKDIVLQDILIEPALTRKATVAWFAPIYDDLQENWRSLTNTLAPVIKHKDASEKRIELITGGAIDMWSLHNPDSGRGRKYQRVVINEASKVKDLEYSWNYVIRPTLLDFGGDAFIGGTPKGFNYFANLCGLADDKWQPWHFSTYDNPHIPRAEIDDLRSTIPERVFQQEIMAEFIEDGAYFQHVEKCAVIEAADSPEQHAGHFVVGGVDWAKSNDWTVITLGCRDCGRVVDWQRFNQIDYHIQRGRLMDIDKRWNVARWIVESNSIGEPNLEELQYSGLPVEGFQTTATTKPQLIEALNLAFVNEQFRVPTEYKDELRAYEVISNSGRTRFGAPAGMHDDTVISAALCWQAMINTTPIITGW